MIRSTFNTQMMTNIIISVARDACRCTPAWCWQLDIIRTYKLQFDVRCVHWQRHYCRKIYIWKPLRTKFCQWYFSRTNGKLISEVHQDFFYLDNLPMLDNIESFIDINVINYWNMGYDESRQFSQKYYTK